MKRLALMATTVLLLAPNVLAQGWTASDPMCGIGWREPENHADSVARLILYHDSGEYEYQIHQLVDAARDYLAARVESRHEERLAAVFDIDETALSNWSQMNECGFCRYKPGTLPSEHSPAIASVLDLFRYAKANGVAVFFVSGRPESQRQLTVNNLKEAGYSDWSDLLMRPDGNTEHASMLKPRKRQEIVDKGYRIVINVGDQASDLAGCCSDRVIKLPNPFYRVP